MTYGQVYSVLGDTSVLNGELGRHRYLFPLYLAVTGYLIWRLSNSKRNLFGLNITLGIGSVILIILPLVQLASNAVMTKINSTANQKSIEQITQNMVDGTVVKPDIYYIILDMYGRDDISAGQLPLRQHAISETIGQIRICGNQVQYVQLQHD